MNNLDLAKTISDFMFMGVENPEDSAKKMFEFRHSFDDKGHWFEKYMRYYFEKYWNYNVELNWLTNEFDNWVDLKWERIEWWKKKKLIVQCKQYNVKDITLDDVACFYWKIADEYIPNKSEMNVYYITTTKFTKKAKDFLEERWIYAICGFKILAIQWKYSLSNFKSDLLEKEWQKEVSLCFSMQQTSLNIDELLVNSKYATNSQVLQLLKQVREDIKTNKQKNASDVIWNKTLKLLSEVRPHNYNALKEFKKTLSFEEKNKIEPIWMLFVDRLKYV